MKRELEAERDRDEAASQARSRGHADQENDEKHRLHGDQEKRIRDEEAREGPDLERPREHRDGRQEEGRLDPPARPPSGEQEQSHEEELDRGHHQGVAHDVGRERRDGRAHVDEKKPERLEEQGQGPDREVPVRAALLPGHDDEQERHPTGRRLGDHGAPPTTRSPPGACRVGLVCRREPEGRVSSDGC
jgi:hypothetical protein